MYISGQWSCLHECISTSLGQSLNKNFSFVQPLEFVFGTKVEGKETTIKRPADFGALSSRSRPQE